MSTSLRQQNILFADGTFQERAAKTQTVAANFAGLSFYDIEIPDWANRIEIWFTWLHHQNNGTYSMIRLGTVVSGVQTLLTTGYTQGWGAHFGNATIQSSTSDKWDIKTYSNTVNLHGMFTITKSIDGATWFCQGTAVSPGGNGAGHQGGARYSPEGISWLRFANSNGLPSHTGQLYFNFMTV